MDDKKDVIAIDLSKINREKGKEEGQHRCEYCYKVFEHQPILAFLKPTQEYQSRKTYPAFQLCSENCKERLKQAGWFEYSNSPSISYQLFLFLFRPWSLVLHIFRIW
jgi:hypothetical protein